MVHYKTQHDVERAIITMYKQRFLITMETLLMNSYGLWHDLGHLGDTEAAGELLDGTYYCSKDIDKVTKELLDQINVFNTQ